MRGKKRIKGRFFVFLLLLAAIAILIIRPGFIFGNGQAVIMSATSSYTTDVPAIFIRDEQVVSSESLVDLEYVAPENTLVYSGDTVAYLYTTGYSQTLLDRLEETRKDIQSYHKTLLANIVDSQLDNLDSVVDSLASNYRSAVNDNSGVSAIKIGEMLEKAMVDRQNYMRSNQTSDVELIQLYQEESSRLSNIASWRTESKAASEGVVSFYLDGYENDLNSDSVSSLTTADINTVLSGGKLENTSDTLNYGVYRIVDQNSWYIAMVTDGNVWNPVLDQAYTLQIDGYDDLVFNATVTRVQKDGSRVLAVFRIDQAPGPLIYARTGTARLSITISGLSVSTKSIYTQNGQTGVWLTDGTFVAVEVLASDGSTAIIEPAVEGALSMGQTIRIN